MIPVMLGVLVIVFTISYFTPGDPVTAILGANYTPESYQHLRVQLGLDKPFFVQLFNYFWNLVTQGDMGVSYSTGHPVALEILHRFPVTFKIGIFSVLIMVGLGIPLGILSATKQYSVADYAVTSLALILAAIPSFVMALFAVLLFSVKLRWLPVTGLDSWESYILPLLSNSLGGIAGVARMTRTSMLEVIRQDYIRTARSKGLKEGLVIRRHALKNALIPVVTVIGFMLSMVMAGSIIVETIFAVPGMGMFMMNGISGRDYPVINGCVLVLSLIICVMNLLVDIVYAFIDPRIKALFITSKRKAKASKQAVPKTREVA